MVVDTCAGDVNNDHDAYSVRFYSTVDFSHVKCIDIKDDELDI